MRKISQVIISIFILPFLLGTALAKDPNPPKKTPELLNQGKKLYEQNCAPCHGPKGEGKGPLANMLTPHPADFALSLKDWPNTKGDPEKVFEVISKGIPNSAMAGFAQFSEKERWGLVYRVTEFSAQPQKKAK
ncbi:MAG: cytochrome c [Thermodesulfobacteriota bacterium]|jgi:mono/diheme cytochrome c family protein